MTVRRGLAIGCGGTLGLAWSAHVLVAVQQVLDWDVREAEVLLGTSAGAELAAVLGSGRTPEQVVAALAGARDADPLLLEHLHRHPGSLPPLPRPRSGATGLVRAGLRERRPHTVLAGLLPVGGGDAAWLRDLGDRVAGDGWVQHPRTWLVAADATTGQRLALGREDAPVTRLGEALAASWAVPGWFPPVRVGGRALVDGGAVSSVSVDLLLDQELDELVVVAPMTSAGGAPGRGLERCERLLRASMTRGLDREVALLERAGTRVLRVEPGPRDLATMGANFMSLPRRAATCRTAARTARGLVEAAATGHRVAEGAQR